MSKRLIAKDLFKRVWFYFSLIGGTHLYFVLEFFIFSAFVYKNGMAVSQKTL